MLLTLCVHMPSLSLAKILCTEPGQCACSLQAAEDPKKKVKAIKDLWSTLKLLRLTPQEHSFGAEERRVVEEVLSGSRNIHEKQRQGFEAPWSLLNR